MTAKPTTAEIVDFSRILAGRRPPRARRLVPPSERGFPAVYRTVATTPQGGTEVRYALLPAGEPDVASVRIDRPDPTLDRGWVVVRRHASMEEAEAYMFGWRDGGGRTGDGLYEDDDGAVFTVLNRLNQPRGKPSPLLVFCTTCVDPWTGEQTDDVVAVAPDGSLVPLSGQASPPIAEPA